MPIPGPSPANRDDKRFILKVNCIASMNKKLKFAKNMALAAGAMFIVGDGTAELSDIIFNSDAINAGVSSVCSYVAGAGSFVLLNARDNYDIFMQNGKFQYREYIKDAGKLFAGSLVLKVPYLVGKFGLTYLFQDQGYDAGDASNIADAFCIPAYLGAWTLVAKKHTRFLEEKVDHSTSIDRE